ncbi:hypothetical protein EH228_04375 [Erwinia endophytica]|uniref:DUF6246 family protein n=1 Tax=Erwinia endophytica TaxID=1563158 RepID=UPI001266001B|nr:DUF6246 family protein [Erwinia endophytica]KAB8312921.1 hypothetical protein EH228_04375 [Erwinia endophytica]
MTPCKEIGECLISLKENDYFFRPSFINMTKIGEPAQIVQTFYDLHNDDMSVLINGAIQAYGRIPQWLIEYISRPQSSKQAVYAAMNTMMACCDDDITPLIGELLPGKTGKWAFVYRHGKMPLADIVLVAQSLIQHGIIGKAKVRKLQRHETQQATSEFNAFEYISAARNHFSMPRSEAEQLTMTEFQMLLAAKYPDQKGFTREEFDAVMDEDERRWQAMLDQDKKKIKSQ